ncbi:LysM peptidoglycan-binding domain-containing protein [Microvirga sp. BT291]|nr:LysM peptidoglycan-binding domain-containing protein [Microvirga pudoricolor]
MLGVAATAVVGVLLGALLWDRTAPGEKSAQEVQAVTPSQVPAKPQASATPPAVSSATPAPPLPQKPETSQAATATTPSDRAAPSKEAAAKPAEGPVVPSFDVVRVEKDGDSVIAGRAAPGATIELLRNDQVHARGVADASGLFAIVPPPLPRGSHQIVLQSIAPDGTRQRSRENVTVVISGDARPLVALAAPDKPTVLLSNPEPPETKPTGPVIAQPVPAPQNPAPATAQANAPRPEVKIVSVDAEEGGRLFVSGQAASGATVRLYLNESFIAPGGAGGDGKVSFAIGRGVKPGDYRIRLDDVDPVSGNVKSRAEVGFIVPPVVASAQPSSPSAGVAGQPTPGEKSATATPLSQALPTNQTASAESTVVIPDINTAIVSRGDSLWRISRRIYGQGVRYTVIFGANQTQIRNPNKIYPGQVFVLPNGEAVQVQN